jgi:hypothetical protein
MQVDSLTPPSPLQQIVLYMEVCVGGGGAEYCLDPGPNYSTEHSLLSAHRQSCKTKTQSCRRMEIVSLHLDNQRSRSGSRPFPQWIGLDARVIPIVSREIRPASNAFGSR